MFFLAQGQQAEIATCIGTSGEGDAWYITIRCQHIYVNQFNLDRHNDLLATSRKIKIGHGPIGRRFIDPLSNILGEHCLCTWRRNSRGEHLLISYIITQLSLLQVILVDPREDLRFAKS